MSKIEDKENNIDYKKQIDELNSKINKITDTMEFFQNTLEKILAENNITHEQNQPMFNSKNDDIAKSNDEIDKNNQSNIILKSGNGKIGKIKGNVKQNELPFFKDTKSLLGGIIGTAFLGIP